LYPVRLFDNTAHSSAGAASTAVGPIFDRLDDSNDLFRSAKILFPFKADASPGTGDSVDIKWKLLHSETTASSDFSDFDDIDGTTQQTFTVSTASQDGVGSADFNLSAAERYVRVEVVEEANGSTVQVDYAGCAVFGGGPTPPAD
jgi:hypothetical protein